MDTNVPAVSWENILLEPYDINHPLPTNLINSTVDVVVAAAVIEHLEDPTQLIKQSYQILNNGGSLIMTTPTPCAKPLLEFLSILHIISRKEIADHKNYFNKKQMISKLKTVGFQIKIARRFCLGFNGIYVATKSNQYPS